MNYQTIQVDDISLEVFYDGHAESPRQWDNMTKFIMFHRRYNLPNEVDIHEQDYSSWDEMEAELQQQYKWVYPVFMYDHGGVAFSINAFSCRWDSGQVGFIVLDDGSAEDAYKCATSELQIYSEYANGNVFGFFVEENGEHIHSCSGFYGSDFDENGLIEELKAGLGEEVVTKIKQELI
jgi:hypothetical protein